MFPQLSQFDLHHRIAENPSPTLVFFSAESCASCRHLKAILARLREQRPEWIIYEVNAQKEMGLTREFDVFHLPAMFLFHNGEFHSELSCEASVDTIGKAILQQLREPAGEAP